MNLFGRTDLSFHGDDVGRFLPWIIAVMVLLASFAIAGAFALNGVAQKWDRGVADSMTIQLPADGNPALAANMRMQALVALKQIAGVLTVRAVPASEVQRQLEPWLGTAVHSTNLPLPLVLEVTIDRKRGVTAEQLGRALELIAPGAAVDDHRVWVEGILRATKLMELVAVIVVILIGGAMVGTVIFATRAELGLQHDAIEVLHLVGARDVYVAHQFARHALNLGLRGSGIGLLLAAPSLVLLDILLQRLEIGLLPQLSLGLAGWICITLLIPLVAGVAMVTARRTVLKALTEVV